jgi:hypothetical protein
VIEQHYRRLLADCPIGAFLIVVLTPILQLFLGVGKGQEPMGVQTLRSEATVEGFDEGVVGRLARRARPEPRS